MHFMLYALMAVSVIFALLNTVVSACCAATARQFPEMFRGERRRALWDRAIATAVYALMSWVCVVALLCAP